MSAVGRRAAWLASKLGLFSTTRPRSEPRAFPSHGFDIIDNDRNIEEEELPEYDPDHFYPVRLGEIFDGRFQTVTKLGYGSSSTIWLARDLQDHRYVALKIYIHNSAQHPSMLARIKSENFSGIFHVAGPRGTHMALVLDASQMSLRDMDAVFMQGRGFDENFVKSAITELLKSLDYLHTRVQAVHTDVHPGNLLLGTEDNSLFKQLEETEMTNPVTRKNLPGRTIYSSRLMKPKVGPLLLSDFGEARLGPGPHAGDIMPIVYRAPETLLWIQWSYAVDIWSVGLTAWDLLEGRTLFSAKSKDGGYSDGVHLSELIAALGPPPRELLNLHPGRARKYWDDDGNWGGFVPIPREKTLEAAETKLGDKTKFLQFMRRSLTWDPAMRPTARELLCDPWLKH
ncbi:hypothetical protein EsDP_00003614 [Epichloe bromicola]|uniref:non-specific serine/threonine protein kinase n=2 Tax=Epichloe bromicola TaxID=79588 RepID=A0ABQ0CPA3_9HYPO